jgi:hypothetical protein
MEGNEKVYRSRKKIIFDNFLGGISWSFGVWIGTSIILLLTFLIASKVDFVPIIGNFVAEITKYVAVHNSPFHF